MGARLASRLPVELPRVTPPCLVHPGRAAVTACSHCGRPCCEDCVRATPSGWRCPSCADLPAPLPGPAAFGTDPRGWAPPPPGADTAPTRQPRPPQRVRFRAPGTGQLGGTALGPTAAGLVVINVIIYVLTRTHNPDNVYYRFGMIPLKVHQGQWYRLFTAAFLHLNTEHILFNMITLVVIGSPVEALVGKVRFVGIYLLAGIGGSVCSYLLSKPNIEGVGASGAIFGLFGAYVVLARRYRFDLRVPLILVAVELFLGIANTGIDWRAHIGGLVTGAVVTGGLLLVERRRQPERVCGELAVAAVVLLVLALLATLPPGHVNL